MLQRGPLLYESFISCFLKKKNEGRGDTAPAVFLGAFFCPSLNYFKVESHGHIMVVSRIENLFR
jgi:hypothetical protein